VQLELIGVISVNGMFLEPLRDFDNLDGIEGALLYTYTTTNAKWLSAISKEEPWQT
jgi:hypothetical protein